MTLFVCPRCGESVEARALQAWHRCAGRTREMRPAPPPERQAAPQVPPAPAQGRLF